VPTDVPTDIDVPTTGETDDDSPSDVPTEVATVIPTDIAIGSPTGAPAGVPTAEAISLHLAHGNGTDFQGDMKVSYEQVKAAFGDDVANLAAARGELFDVDPSNFSVPELRRDLALENTFFWTTRNVANNKAQIAYAFVSGDFTVTEEANIVGWLNEINLECAIEFIARTTEAHYISIQSSDNGCYSYVGNIDFYLSPQPVNLDSGCVYASVVKHEFLHAAGFFHEQS
jgi:hypothetical protein